MGTPSVLLRGSTAAEVISDNNNGFLLDNSPEQFGQLISHFASDRSELKKAATGARNSLVRSWEDVVDEVSERYKVIIKNHHKR